MYWHFGVDFAFSLFPLRYRVIYCDCLANVLHFSLV